MEIKRKSVTDLVIILQLLLLSYTSSSQVTVRFVVKDHPGKHSTESVFITGNFSSWQPGDTLYRLHSNSNTLEISFHLKPGSYVYKFTRGSWEKGEVSLKGIDISNRQLNLLHDTTIYLNIEGWRDDFPVEQIKRKSTASSNVRLFDSAFLVPQLNRKKGIWIYLPPGYSGSNKNGKRYPVIYMHDGQNLFDERTSGFGQEWGVDEILDSMIAHGTPPAIVVGINNDPVKRLNEYNPYDHEKYGKAEGDAYLKFIVQTLKPFIDKHFKTAAGIKTTFIAGSSMGGLISMYAVIKYPKVFGGAGVFSPAFWIGKSIEKDVQKSASKLHSRIWFYAGGKEGETMVPDMKAVEEILSKTSSAKITEVVDVDAKHNEAAWRKWFPEFYRWVMIGL